MLSPALLGWMALRARRSGGDWEVCSGARFGRYAQSSSLSKPVWVHAVRLGETRAAEPLIQALLDQGESVLLTPMTVTGRAGGPRWEERRVRKACVSTCRSGWSASY